MQVTLYNFAALSRNGILLNYFLVYFYVIIYNFDQMTMTK